jgi:hypothetical protein
MCYFCLEQALRGVVPAVVREVDLGQTESSPETADVFVSAVSTVAAASNFDKHENPVPAAAKILTEQLVEWLRTHDTPSPARMLQFLLNVCIRMSSVEEANPRNIKMPGIGRISPCIDELLPQLRLAAAKAQID